jgi:carbonic anhydrase/acetyltransferase-like protein (isoleucine patch superfamily)
VLERFADKFPRIDPTAFVHATAVVIGDVVLGAESSVWPNVTLRGDDGPILIGRQTSVQDNSVIHCTEGLSFTTVGDRVTVGHSVVLHGCTIHDDVLIGMGSVVLDNAIVESGAIVAAGTVVPPRKVVRAGTLVAGNPMRLVRECGEKEREMIVTGWRAYVARAAQYRR